MRGVRGAAICAIAIEVVLTCAGHAQAIKDIPPTCESKGGVVTVDGGYWQTTIERRGDRIVPTYAKGEVKCDPIKPTVSNTDTIAIPSEGTIDLRGGPFAPGISAEADGSPEIEFEIVGDSTGPLEVLYGSGDDRVLIASRPHGELGINLDSSEADTDAELTMTPAKFDGLRLTNITFRLGAGDDILDADGTKASVGQFEGGPGDDILIGSESYDEITGGAGADIIDGRRAADLIRTRDNAKDLVACGPGRDTLFRDRRDRGTQCERNYLPGEEPPPPDIPHVPGFLLHP